MTVSQVPSLLSYSPSFSLTSLGQLCSSVRETEDYVVDREGAFEQDLEPAHPGSQEVTFRMAWGSPSSGHSRPPSAYSESFTQNLNEFLTLSHDTASSPVWIKDSFLSV